jgi:signal transduction histidine kinase
VRGSGAPLSDARVINRVEAIDRDAKRLGALIDHVLDITRVTAGRLKLELEPIDLADLARCGFRGRMASHQRRCDCVVCWLPFR